MIFDPSLIVRAPPSRLGPSRGRARLATFLITALVLAIVAFCVSNGR